MKMSDENKMREDEWDRLYYQSLSDARKFHLNNV